MQGNVKSMTLALPLNGLAGSHVSNKLINRLPHLRRCLASFCVAAFANRVNEQWVAVISVVIASRVNAAVNAFEFGWLFQSAFCDRPRNYRVSQRPATCIGGIDVTYLGGCRDHADAFSCEAFT